MVDACKDAQTILSNIAALKIEIVRLSHVHGDHTEAYGASFCHAGVS